MITRIPYITVWDSTSGARLTTDGENDALDDWTVVLNCPAAVTYAATSSSLPVILALFDFHAYFRSSFVKYHYHVNASNHIAIRFSPRLQLNCLHLPLSFALLRYEESCLAFSSSNVLRNKTLRLENRKEIIEKKVFEVPELIQTLNAFQFYEKPDRACLELGPSNSMPTPVTYSDCGSPLGMIRAAMLMVWSALPQGCLDEQVGDVM